MAIELSMLFKPISVLPLPIVQELRARPLRLIEHARQSLQRYKDLLTKDPEFVASKPMLFSKLFRAKDDGGLTDADMEVEAVAYIVAGSGTTSTTLTYLVWAVAQRPAMQEKLVAELAVLSDDFTYDDLQHIPYLDHLIDETLRLYGPAAGGLPRIVPPGGRTLGGHFVPEGLTVTTQSYTLHRDPSVFDEPETFRPSRWENATPAMRDAFMPFGGGTRGEYTHSLPLPASWPPNVCRLGRAVCLMTTLTMILQSASAFTSLVWRSASPSPPSSAPFREPRSLTPRARASRIWR